MARKRIAWIDAAKVISIVSIVWVHFLYNNADGSNVVKQYIYSYTAQLLFMLSGYLFKPEEDLKGGIIKRIKSIMVPFWFFILLWYPFGYLFHGETPAQLLQELAFLDGNLVWHSPMWFLPTLFCTWLICILAAKIHRGLVLQIVLVALCILISQLMPRSLKFLRTFGVLRALGVLPMFVFGHWCRRWSLVDKVRERPYLIAVLFAAGILGGMVFSPKITIYGYNYGREYYVTLVSGLATSVGICALLSYRDSYPPQMSLIANGTIFMMATHMPLVDIYREYLEPWVLLHGELFATLFTAAIAAAIIALQCLLMPILRRNKTAALLTGLR